MSGYAQAGIIGECYRLVLVGGASSWDYDEVRGTGNALGAALDALKPQLDEAFREDAARFGLKIVPYGTHKNRVDTEIREVIPNTTFSINLWVSGSVKPDDMSRVLMSFVECIQGSDAMKRLIYDDPDAFPELKGGS